MKDLLATLNAYDPGMLPALAEVWGIDAKGLAPDELLPRLHDIMLDPNAAEATWDKLDDGARAALQLLASSDGKRMKIAQFERFYGVARKLGRAGIEKDKPHTNGQSIAETLYYRGFIGEAYDRVDGAVLLFVYVAPDLAEALPLHKTSFDRLGDEEPPFSRELTALAAIDEAAAATPADTTIVDDMTTLLASIQAKPGEISDASLEDQVVESLLPHMLNRSQNRLQFLFSIGLGAGIVAVEEGAAQPQRERARDFLMASRTAQIRQLSLAWLGSELWRDMWHIPGLFPEDSGWSYDAASARDAVMSLFGELLPAQGWVSVSDLIELIKATEPDFQRPDGDYESWYIRNAAGEYLSGYESWDAVEGALVEFYLMGPMHWLGLVDIGEDAARLTAYGRAFLERSEWPQPDERPHKIQATPDGALEASRRVNRFDRFQLARFAAWRGAGDPYVYRLDADSIKRAAAQGIQTDHIQAFIARQLEGAPLPVPIVNLLRNWQDGARTTVSFERHLTLRATDEATLDKIYAMPALRRHLGARLGPLACVVRADQWRELRAKLGEEGVDVDAGSIEDERP